MVLLLALAACTKPSPVESPLVSGTEGTGAVFLMTADEARPAQPTCSTQGPISIGFYVATRADGRRELVGRYLDEPGEPAVPQIEWPKGFKVAPGPPVQVLSNDGDVVASEGGSAMFTGASVGNGVFSPCIIDGTYYPGG